VVSHVANEPLLLARYQQKQADAFARLWPRNAQKAISEQLDKIAVHLGGPPRLYILRHDENPPPEMGFRERLSKSPVSLPASTHVPNSRAYVSGRESGRGGNARPDQDGDDPEVAKTLLKLSQEAFWEHAEAAYIRLASYWDGWARCSTSPSSTFGASSTRVQSVMDRIDANVAKMGAHFARTGSWTRLRSFQFQRRKMATSGYKSGATLLSTVFTFSHSAR